MQLFDFVALLIYTKNLTSLSDSMQEEKKSKQGRVLIFKK